MNYFSHRLIDLLKEIVEIKKEQNSVDLRTSLEPV